MDRNVTPCFRVRALKYPTQASISIFRRTCSEQWLSPRAVLTSSNLVRHAIDTRSRIPYFIAKVLLK